MSERPRILLLTGPDGSGGTMPAPLAEQCDVVAVQSPSEGLAALLSTHMQKGAHRLVFAIGGADGLTADLSPRAPRKLSFGRLTLPHRLARLILLEQLYRALSIVYGEPYHRA